jgi:hypothetical protein
MPDALGVAVHFADAVKWDSMNLSFGINELKSLRAVSRKSDFFQRDQNDAVLRAIVVAQLEASFAFTFFLP